MSITNYGSHHKVDNNARSKSFIKEVDAWWTVLVIDRIAIPLVRRLSKYHFITPNFLTIISLVIGLIAALLIIMSTTPFLIVGGILYQLAFLFDCMDGKLARLRGITSPLGEILDNVADRVTIFTLSFAVGYTLYNYYNDAFLFLNYIVYAYLTVMISNIWLIYDKHKTKNIKVNENNITILTRMLSSRDNLLKNIAVPVIGFFRKHRLWPYPSEIEFNLILFTIVPILHALLHTINLHRLLIALVMTINIMMIVVVALRLYFICTVMKSGDDRI